MLAESTFQLGSHTLNVAQGPPSGPPLVMLHGVTRKWQTFLPLVPTLVPRWQILGLDFRGHGASTPVEDGYLIVDYVRDAVALLHELNEPVVLYGHSLGAMVVPAVAAEVPDRVRGVVLEDPPLNMLGPKVEETTFHSFFKGIQSFVGDTRDVRQIAQDLSRMVLLDPTTGQEMLLGTTRDAASLRFMASCLRDVDPNVLSPIIEGRWLEGYDIPSIYERLECPALLIQADVNVGGMLTDEDASDVETIARDLTRIKLPGIGHNVHWASSERLSGLVLQFIESVRG